MKILKYLLIAFGLYVLYMTVRDVGVENLFRNISALGWKLVPLLLFYTAIFAFNTIGWGYAFPDGYPKNVRFRDLYRIRVIGETMNGIVPFSASLGGEPLKAEMLKRRSGVPLSETYASILIVHTTFWISLNLFLIGGTLVVPSRPLTPVLANSVYAFLAVLGFLALLLAAGLYFGVFRRVHALGEKWKLWGAFSEEKSRRFDELDGRIRDYYKDPKNVVLSTLYNFLAWMTGAFETWFAANLVGIQLTFLEAWMFESLIQTLRIMTFFIPSSIGVQEGGIVFIFSQYGFPNPLSVTYAVVRRLREIVWTALALLMWTFWKEKPEIRS